MSPEIGSLYAVAPGTIGTFAIGLINVSSGLTSAVLYDDVETTKFLPRQPVSIFVLHSLSASVRRWIGP